IQDTGRSTDLLVDDSGDTRFRTASVATQGTSYVVLHGLAPADINYYDGVNALTVYGGSGNNVFTVDAVSASGAISLYAGSGPDVVTASPSADLWIDGQGGPDYYTVLLGRPGTVTVADSGPSTDVNALTV